MGLLDDAEDVGSFAIGGPVGLAGVGLIQNPGIAKDIGLDGATTANQNKMNNQNAVGAQGMELAGYGQGQLQQLGTQGQGALNSLLATANGKNSVSAEQLRQGLQQNQAAQQSMAAGAGPSNAAMAGRTAAIQSGRLGAGLAGQQAVAGLQERNQAQQNYASLLGNLRQQDLGAATGGLGAANQAYGGGLNGQADPSIISQVSPIIQGAMKVGG